MNSVGLFDLTFHSMKGVKFTVGWITGVLIFHAISAQIEAIPEWINWVIFLVSPLLVIHLALTILMDDKTTDKKWEEGYFYQDREQMFTSIEEVDERD